jgi:hypothetical protein
MALDVVKNFALVTVSTGYDASATSIVLATGHGAKLPATHGYSVIWWNYTDYKNPSDDPNVEIVRVTARTTDTLTVTRAQETTSSATHNTADKVYKMMLGITAKMITDITSTFVAKADYDAQTIMAAITDNTPAALTISEQTLLGRKTGGDVTALTAADILLVLGITSTITELNYTDGVTSAIQTQLEARLPLAGGTMSGSITLGENTGIALDPAGSADEKWSGIEVTGTAGATLAVGDLCYLNSSWKWVLADADTAAGAGSVALGLCILAAAGDNSATNMLLMGTMRSAALPASITGGAQLYVSQTAGDMTTTIPTGADVIVRVVGWAITTEPNTIYFNPSSDFITRVS